MSVDYRLYLQSLSETYILVEKKHGIILVEKKHGIILVTCPKIIGTFFGKVCRSTNAFSSLQFCTESYESYSLKMKITG